MDNVKPIIEHMNNISKVYPPWTVTTFYVRATSYYGGE